MNVRAFKYLLPFGIYFATWRAFHHTGWVTWLPVLYAFGIIPLIELLIPADSKNMTQAEEAIAQKDPIYDWFLYLIVPMQYLALYWFLHSVTDPGLLWWERTGRIAGMALSCGAFGINVGHELGHRMKTHEQWMAKSLLLTSLYTHFFIEHNKGHHKNVSTPVDPSSAPKGMGLYRFWLRSVTGTWMDAWKIAAADLRKKGLPAVHYKNEMLQLQLLQLFFIIAIGIAFGWQACGYFILAAIGGFLLLETVNYIEHYGLCRKEMEAGKYERALPQHSWNSNHVLGRLMLFELSRHSDHHYLASRKYQILRHHDEAPQLPTGYPGSMMLATIPPLWFWIMDPKIDDLSKEANLADALT
ncbi:MAG: alkane 1-monooxygenase [Chitinophagaceae bacterium]|jgi:alkane 1-monooxygenase|nr:alkane 1-monooxygenase [Chitinophagaceae bacterium]MCU0402917.1 alkane 1-monooxygenase [Chitinophagaceae bacterium]